MATGTFDWIIATGIPVAAMGAMAVLLPVALVRLHRPSLALLALDLLIAAIVLILAGSALFAALYAAEGVDLSRRGAEAALHFLRLGLSASIVWLPLLLLTGIALGQRTEARLSRLREAIEARQ